MSQMLKGVLGPVVLALFENGEIYGLALASRLKKSGLVSSLGTVYPLLIRLECSGLLQSEWKTEGIPRPRRYYRLTDSGKTELNAFRTDWQGFKILVDQLLEESVNSTQRRR